MNHKKLLAFCILLLMPLLAMAKGEAAKYVVSKVSGRVEVIDAKGKRQVDKGCYAECVFHWIYYPVG